MNTMTETRGGNITIHSANGVWVVRADGAVIAESANALELLEDGHLPVIYFPPSDVATAFLDATETRTTCPRKGEASYFAVTTMSKTLEDAAWSYETPKEDAARIAGYIAFYSTPDVTVERL